MGERWKSCEKTLIPKFNTICSKWASDRTICPFKTLHSVLVLFKSLIYIKYLQYIPIKLVLSYSTFLIFLIHTNNRKNTALAFGHDGFKKMNIELYICINIFWFIYFSDELVLQKIDLQNSTVQKLWTLEKLGQSSEQCQITCNKNISSTSTSCILFTRYTGWYLTVLIVSNSYCNKITFSVENNVLNPALNVWVEKRRAVDFEFLTFCMFYMIY